jgi:hypothetical protein
MEIDSTVVEHVPHQPKVEGMNVAIGLGVKCAQGKTRGSIFSCLRPSHE